MASIAIHGGAPGVRDTGLLEPEMTVEAVDALVLSGGSAFGLDSMGGTMAALAEAGRGFAVGQVRVPIVPGAVLFDLANGGDKAWGRRSPYWDLGYAAARAAGLDFGLGSVGAGLGATTATLKGGLGSASLRSDGGYWIGALAAVNALGQATIGDGPQFWAAPYERDAEFGGFGLPHPWPAESLALRAKGSKPENTTICIVATDAPLTKAQCKRLAVVAQGGLAMALRPAHAALDGDVVFAAATGSNCTARNGPRPHRDRRARGRHAGPRRGARRLRGTRPALSGRPAELAGPFRHSSAGRRPLTTRTSSGRNGAFKDTASKPGEWHVQSRAAPQHRFDRRSPSHADHGWFS